MTMDGETTYLEAKMFDNKPVCMRIRSLVTAMLAQLDVKHLIFIGDKSVDQKWTFSQKNQR